MTTVQNVMRTRRCAHAQRKRTHTIMHTCAHAQRRSHRDLRGLTAIRESTIKIESYALIGKSSVNARAVSRMHARAHDRTRTRTHPHTCMYANSPTRTAAHTQSRTAAYGTDDGPAGRCNGTVFGVVRYSPYSLTVVFGCWTYGGSIARYIRYSTWRSLTHQGTP